VVSGGSLPATPENVRRALDTFDRFPGSDDTISSRRSRPPAICLAGPRIDRSVVVIADGCVSV